MHAGADEDVEAVMARLAAQSAENAALKEHQAKLDKDQKVGLLHPGCAITGRTFGSGFLLDQGSDQMVSVLHPGCASTGRTCGGVFLLY